VPGEFIAEGILQSFAGMDLHEKRILIPRASKARDVLPEGLKKLGADVDVVETYRTVNSGGKKEDFEMLIRENKVDVITFTSSSTVTNFVEIMGQVYEIPRSIEVACIGPVTAAAAKKAGFKIDIRQEEYTMDGLVQSLVDHFQQKEEGKR
jgi:uroporphyrinogen III methyltransferase/synthase